MDTTWYELQIGGIEVEERQISQEEFERLFDGEHTFPVNRSPFAWSGPDN
jgi:predicted phage tail protein